MKVDLEATVTKPVNKLDSTIAIVQEKVAREFGLTIEEARNSIITIKDGELTVKGGKK